MDCPRCHMMLRTTDYEGVEVDICDNCWGIWLDSGELEQIIDAKDMNFSDAERRQLTSFRGGASAAPAPAGDPPAACPKCGAVMEPVYSDAAVHLIVDRCPAHGVWLDTGEIKTVQAVAEQSAELHRLLLQKLGLLGG